MASDLAIAVEDRPGQLAGIGEALGNAGVNIEGGFGSGSTGTIHVLVENAGEARKALEGAGYRVTDENEAMVFPAEDRPGFLGNAARKIADAGVNIDHIYVATNNRMVLITKDVEAARRAIS